MSTFKSLNEEAKSFVSQQDYNSAFLSYTKIITLENASAVEKSTAYSNRSYVLLKLSKLENAKKDALKSIELTPKWSKGYLRAGNASLASKDIDEALKFYKEGFGKEDDNGSLGKAYSDVYFSYKYQIRTNRANVMYPRLQEFLDVFFSDREKAMKICEFCYGELLKMNANSKPFEQIITEMHNICFENTDLLSVAKEETEYGAYYNANLCLWEMHRRENKQDVKTNLLRQIGLTFALESFFDPKNTIQTQSCSIKPHPKKYSIDLKEVVNIFWKYMPSNYWPATPYFDYYLKEIRKNGTEWCLAETFPPANISNFYKCEEPQKSKNIYWKFFCNNACSHINTGFAKLIESLLKQGIVPYVTYKETPDSQEEKIDILAPFIMQVIVKKEFSNPWVYFSDKDCWIPLLRGHDVNKFLHFGFGHTISTFLTKKIIRGQNLSFFIDLTVPQYDIFQYTEKGFPYLERAFLSSEHKNDVYLFGSFGLTVQEWEARVKNKKVFLKEGLIEAEKKSIQDIKSFLKIA